MARSSSRAAPYVVEMQPRQHHVSKDKSSRNGKKERDIRPPHITSNPSVSPHVHSRTTKSHVSNESGIPKAREVFLDPSRLNRGSLEYEDIYNQRNYRGETSHLGQYGRYSFRDDNGYGRYGRVRSYRRDTRRSPGIARGTKMSAVNVEVRHVLGKTVDRKDDMTEARYQNGTVSDGNGHTGAKYKGHKGTSQEQKRTAKDSNANRRDDLELWIARQTSFPKNVKQDARVDTSNQRIPRNTAVSQNSTKIMQPPPVAPKPSRPQTSRSSSPTSSIRSNTSGVSRVSQHSAKSGTSEVSVKSILKKPKVGRVVLKEEPSSYTLCAVLSCILCFPFGIYALAKSKQVDEAVDENDYESALISSRKVKHFCIGVLLAYIGILAIAGALLAVYFTTGKIV